MVGEGCCGLLLTPFTRLFAHLEPSLMHLHVSVETVSAPKANTY